MNKKHRVVIAQAAYLALVAGVVSLAALAFYHDLPQDDRTRLWAMFTPRTELIAGLAVLALGLLGILFALAYHYYVAGAQRMAEGLGIILRANRAHRIAVAGPAETRVLAKTINDLAERNEQLAQDLESKVEQAKASVEEEKNRLAALMSELSQGVLVCNTDGRILLYNERARQVLGNAGNSGSAGAGPVIGLGRSVFGIIDRNLLAHALETVSSRLEKCHAELNAQFVTTTRADQLVRVQMAPVLVPRQPFRAGEAARADGAAPAAPVPAATIRGFVMTLENITRTFERDTTRDMLLQSFTEGSRASLANIRAAVETLTAYPDCEPAERERFIAVISQEVADLSGKLDRTTSEYADSLKTRWPLEEMLAADVVAAARRRVESRLALSTNTEDVDASVWVKADSYTLIQSLTYLAGRLKDAYDVRDVRFQVTREGRLAQLDLIWSGPIISQQTVYDWELDTMRAGGEDSPLTLRAVTERHGAEFVYLVEKPRQRCLFRLLLPAATPVQTQSPVPSARYGESRPEFYDFDLFHRAGQSTELDESLLTELAYTVIDTETTGLDPSRGDEIVSIGAARILNNRLLRYETYEQLVDPKRPIASLSQSIHGITPDMLVDQPTIEAVLPQLFEFCEDTVIVGHNAAFDMRFLQMKEEKTGIRFTHPVLDTLLLSEVLNPNQTSHTLESIAGRFGVNVVARHTALGDALVTGEVFLRMLPLLAAQGIHTLRDAREAAEKTLYAKVKY